jgi:prepilin-type N-terminal cleavage/methylation domain-containing protein
LVRSLLKDGRGYSLIEVMVSIILLALAIIPMVGMFDMGLKGVTASSHYDKARTLANLKLEQAKNLPFTDVEGNFPAGNPTPYDEPDTWLQGEDEDAEFTGLDYRVVKQYMLEPPTNPGSSVFFVTSGTPTDLIRLRVEVRWGEDNDGDDLPDKSFTTYGLVAR